MNYDVLCLNFVSMKTMRSWNIGNSCRALFRSWCRFKDRLDSVGWESVQKVLGHLKKQSKWGVISKRRVVYAPGALYTYCRPSFTIPNTALDVLTTSIPQKMQTHNVWLIQPRPCALWTLSSQGRTCLDWNKPPWCRWHSRFRSENICEA